MNDCLNKVGFNGGRFVDNMIGLILCIIDWIDDIIGGKSADDSGVDEHESRVQLVLCVEQDIGIGVDLFFPALVLHEDVVACEPLVVVIQFYLAVVVPTRRVSLMGDHTVKVVLVIAMEEGVRIFDLVLQLHSFAAFVLESVQVDLYKMAILRLACLGIR